MRSARRVVHPSVGNHQRSSGLPMLGALSVKRHWGVTRPLPPIVMAFGEYLKDIHFVLCTPYSVHRRLIIQRMHVWAPSSFIMRCDRAVTYDNGSTMTWRLLFFILPSPKLKLMMCHQRSTIIVVVIYAPMTMGVMQKSLQRVGGGDYLSLTMEPATRDDRDNV